MSRQDVENAAPWRIDQLRQLAETLGSEQAILFTYNQENGTVITTWGDTVERSAQAAAGANKIKKLWSWPETDLVESAKVQALRDRIAELEALLKAEASPSKTFVVYVIEGTEYERGWGCRPDGYVAFTSLDAAEKYIVDFNAKYNNEKSAPDEYTRYEYIGLKECSAKIYGTVKANGSYYVNKLKELQE